MRAVCWDAPGSRHREGSTKWLSTHPPAKVRVRLPVHPKEEFWRCDLLPDWTTTISPSEPIWWAPARPVHERKRRRRFGHPDTKRALRRGKGRVFMDHNPCLSKDRHFPKIRINSHDHRGGLVHC